MKDTLLKALAGLALVALLSFEIFAVVVVQGPPRGGDPANHVGGQVSAIGSSSITVKTRDGSSQVINVTDKTTFERNRQPASLGDFKVNDFAGAHGSRDASGQFTADHVTGGDAPPPGGPRGGPGRGAGGQVVSVDTAAGTITVKARDDASRVIYTTAYTTFNRNRQPATIGDFKAGDHIRADGAPNANGQFVADHVFGGDQPPPRTN
ncbi:MAG TPA: DUF5666 domain-containing protein [Blastocatellia bacterium]|nr:DUF5666 domain-containing protein [Blastocatellia bacterium]